MRILFLHPEDTPERGPWVGQNWDWVTDLGHAGTETYKRWGALLGCVAEPLDILSLEEVRGIRELLGVGVGRLRDREGLDWWELNAMFFHQRLETLIALRSLVNRLGNQDQLFVTRSGFHADVLGLLAGDRLKCFSGRSTGGERSLSHYRRVWSRFPLPQLFEILGDKYDAAYGIRRRFARRTMPCQTPVVLLPSAYGNVSRTGIAYAKTSPETNFLLMTTRRSGEVSNPPANVSCARLAAYATHRPQTAAEHNGLAEQWRELRCDLQSVPEFDLLERLGSLDSFPRLLRQGLAIRDAWRSVLEQEPVQAVLCGDDSNPYTHIPLLLARGRGIPTIACHHGALDGRHLFKQNYADVILAKGRMEEDYLVRVCGVSPDVVEVGAPARSVCHRLDPQQAGAAPIVFFSEAYEIAGGRGEEFYRELLPAMADLAARTGRDLWIKLHPAESRRDRERLVNELLSAEQRHSTKIISAPLTQELLSGAWFGITIRSTVVMECALLGIPCFLCEWLEYGPYGYVEQFSRFRAGHGLGSAAQIGEIPRTLEHWSSRPETVRDLWQSITPDRFRELVSSREMFRHVVAS